MTSSETAELRPNLRSRRRPRWVYLWVGLAAFAITVALFYAEENWRGKRTWQRYKRALEDRGKVIDWSAYVPAPVPDDQNIFKAPQMDWFINKNGVINSLGQHFSDVRSLIVKNLRPRVTVAELRVAHGHVHSNDADGGVVIALDLPDGKTRLVAAMERAIGPRATGCTQLELLPGSLDKTERARLVLESDRNLDQKELSTWLPGFELRPSGSNSWTVSLVSVASAADYLAWTDALEPDFETLRRGLERPWARIDSDYRLPFEAPIPNFVAIRLVVQLLSERAQCHLLLSKPDKALAELDLVRKMLRLLVTPPASRPMTLVAAMIHVAVNGLYIATVNDGMRLGVWREPELTELQQQLAQVNLVPFVTAALQVEVAAVCQTVQISRVPKIFAIAGERSKFSLWDLMPRGWIYQNIIVYTKLMEQQIDVLESSRPWVVPHALDQAERAVDESVTHVSPYNLIARIAIPNTRKAFQRTAENQTMANQAQIVCALERYRLRQGQYPAALEALLPRDLAAIPRDPIEGNLPHYRRTADGRFLLYSIGWSEKDHGGHAGTDPLHCDWVWNSNMNH